MFTSVALLCASVCCAWALLWLRSRRVRSLLAHLPTYPQIPFIGNLHYLSRGREAMFQCLLDMSLTSEKQNLPFLLWVGSYPALVFIDPDEVKTVTNAFIAKPYYYDFAHLWLGNGLVTAPVSIWKHSIKALAGTFNGSTVEGYQHVFNAQAKILAQRLKTKVGIAPFSIMDDLAYSTLETICQTALGSPGASENIVTAEYYSAFSRAAQLILRRGLNLMTHPEAIFRLTPGYSELNRCLEVIHSVSNTIFDNRKKEWEGSKKERDAEKARSSIFYRSISSNKFKSFLDILLELSETDPHFTEEQIKNEVSTIIVGGQETTASTIFYTLLMLGRHDNVQEKLYAELKEIFGDSDRAVEKEDLQRMQYCEAVLLETMRLLPPVPALMRYADRDLKLKSCVVPKGSTCVISPLGAGRSKTNWGPDALEFKPERWLNTDLQNTHSASFLAFSYGRRTCIGRKYAMSLMKTTIAHVVRAMRVHVAPEPPLRLRFELVIRPVEGHLIQLNLR